MTYAAANDYVSVPIAERQYRLEMTYPRANTGQAEWTTTAGAAETLESLARLLRMGAIADGERFEIRRVR